MIGQAVTIKKMHSLPSLEGKSGSIISARSVGIKNPITEFLVKTESGNYWIQEHNLKARVLHL